MSRSSGTWEAEFLVAKGSTSPPKEFGFEVDCAAGLVVCKVLLATVAGLLLLLAVTMDVPEVGAAAVFEKVAAIIEIELSEVEVSTEDELSVV